MLICTSQANRSICLTSLSALPSALMVSNCNLQAPLKQPPNKHLVRSFVGCCESRRGRLRSTVATGEIRDSNLGGDLETFNGCYANGNAQCPHWTSYSMFPKIFSCGTVMHPCGPRRLTCRMSSAGPMNLLSSAQNNKIGKGGWCRGCQT